MNRMNADIIRRLRKEKRMTVKECADLCSLSVDNYIKLEAGEFEPGYGNLVLLGKALGFSGHAFQMGTFLYKKDLRDLTVLTDQLEEKIKNLEQGLAEIKAEIQTAFEKVKVAPEIREESTGALLLTTEATAAAAPPVLKSATESPDERIIAELVAATSAEKVAEDWHAEPHLLM